VKPFFLSYQTVIPFKFTLYRYTGAADVRFEPYPHLIVKDALPAQLYAQLAGSFPTNTMFQVGKYL
jgi:hypothetical protein